jgi:hypothetical protein
VISEEQAMEVMTPLAIAFSYADDQFQLWMDMMQGLKSPEAAKWAAQTLIRNAETTFVPGWGAFQAIYDGHAGRIAALEAERTLELEESGRNSFPNPRRGMEIARETYEREHHRPVPGNIWASVGTSDDQSTSSEDVAAAVAVLRAGQQSGEHLISSYRDVLKATDSDHRRARGALRALELQRTIIWNNNGTLVLVGGAR